MKTQLRLASLAVLAAAASLAGCRTAVNAVDPANPSGKPDPLAMSHTVTDNSLSDACVPVFYSKGKTPAGFLVVQLQVQNQTRSMARLNYNVEWFDTNGLLITASAGGQWKPLTLEAGKTETLRQTAPQADAADAKFHFMESKH